MKRADDNGVHRIFLQSVGTPGKIKEVPPIRQKLRPAMSDLAFCGIQAGHRRGRSAGSRYPKKRCVEIGCEENRLRLTPATAPRYRGIAQRQSMASGGFYPP